MTEISIDYEDTGNENDIDVPVVETLPEPGALPPEIETGSVEEFVWKQRERRRIFTQEVDNLRHNWAGRRKGIIDEIDTQQKNLQRQLQQLEQVMMGRNTQVKQLYDMMGDVRAHLERNRKKKGETDDTTAGSEKAAVSAIGIAADPIGKHAEEAENEPLIEEPPEAVAEILEEDRFHQGESAGMRESRLKMESRSRCRKFLFFQNEHASRTALLGRFLSKPLVEAFCISVIAIHAVVMGVNAEYNARNWKEKTKPWFVLNAEMIFYIWYVVELVFRLLAFRGNFFLNSDWHWNVFDLLCVIPWQLLQEIGKSDGRGGGGMSFFRVIRMLKMAKMLRVIRLMRFFRELRLMMRMMTQSMMTLCWTVVMLAMMYYVFAIIFMYGMIGYLEDSSMHDAQNDAGLRTHWSSLWKCFCSLYYAMTGGYDWKVLADEILALGEVYYYIFLFFIVFMVFGMMNIILGMFCEAASTTSRKDNDTVLAEESRLADGYIKAVSAIFQEIDVDKTGKISWDEFNTLATTNEKVRDYLEWLDIDPKNARQLFRAFAGKSEMVGIDVFLDGLTKVRGDASRLQIAQMEQDLLVSMKQASHFMMYFQEMTSKLYPLCLGNSNAPGTQKPSAKLEFATSQMSSTTALINARKSAKSLSA